MPKEPTLGESLDFIFDKMLHPSSYAKNLIYHEAGWRMSYNPHCPDTDSDETAIILGKDECFLILYGDHRDSLKGKTRDEAVAYWQERPELRGFTSDTMEA